MKKYLFVFCAIMQVALCEAAVRTSQEAARLAAEFTNNQSAQNNARSISITASGLSLAHTFCKPLRQDQANPEPAVYVFNKGAGKGFVLVSADDRTLDILCYSDEGDFDISTANPDFLWWINRYIQEITNVDSENAYTDGSAVSKTATTTAISPLLGDIAWDQEEPYWNQCPMDLNVPSERCLTGCVATAAAQIMRFWKYPAQGTGSHTYTWYCYDVSYTSYKTQELSLDFSDITFDWDNMLDTYGTSSSSYTAEEADAVAALMYACGVACDMSFGGSTAGGSGSYTDCMGNGMVTYLGYKNTAKYLSTYSESEYGECAMDNVAWSQTISELTTAFNEELEAGRPVLVGGASSSSGHEFVCDGRDTAGKFHINWGWSGSCNCYCALSSLKPSGTSYKFSDEVDAIVGIEPYETTIINSLDFEEDASITQKILANGRFLIRKGNHCYTASGSLVR